MRVEGTYGAAHRRLLQQANAMLASSPSPVLLGCVQTIHQVLLSTDPKALRRSVGWLGRLLGRDIALQAESEALRSQLGVHVLQARRQLEALAEHNLELQALGTAVQLAINEIERQSTVLAGQVVADANDSLRRMQHLATLAASLRIAASHLDLTQVNHRGLSQRVEQMLPTVELLLDQQRMLRAGHTEQTAMQAATKTLEALQGLEHVNVTAATPDDDTPR